MSYNELMEWCLNIELLLGCLYFFFSLQAFRLARRDWNTKTSEKPKLTYYNEIIGRIPQLFIFGVGKVWILQTIFSRSSHNIASTSNVEKKHIQFAKRLIELLEFSNVIIFIIKHSTVNYLILHFTWRPYLFILMVRYLNQNITR